MPEKPKWLKYIFDKYGSKGLGTVIIDPQGHCQVTTDNSEDPDDLGLAYVLGDIERDIKGLEFLEKHPKGPGKWRIWAAKGKKTF